MNRITGCTKGAGKPEEDCLLPKVEGDSAMLYTTFRTGQIDMSRSTYDGFVEGLRRLPSDFNSGTIYVAGFTITFGATAPREEQDIPSTHVENDLTRGVIIMYGGTALFANTAEWIKFLTDHVHTGGATV